MLRVFLMLGVLVHLVTGIQTFNNNFKKVNLRFIYGPKSTHQVKYFPRNVTKLLSHKRFNAHRPTVLFVSGWMMSPEAETTQLITKAYLKRGDHNILVLDWSDYSVGTYSNVMIRMSRLSRIYGRTISKLFDKGLNIKSFHCVGHSFGAHSCGIMGRELQQVSNRKYKFERITGLDPAGPLFFPVAFEKPLNTNDAMFVDSIHSDVFLIGTPFSTGHVDFFPNYNMVQPACQPLRFLSLFDFISSMCSHFYGLRFWANAIASDSRTLSPFFKCPSAQDFQQGRCKVNEQYYIGISANRSAQGFFFASTNAQLLQDNIALYKFLLQRIGQRASELLNFNFNFSFKLN